jgi:hypothetical protein
MAKDIETKVVINYLAFIINHSMDHKAFLKKMDRFKVKYQNHTIKF